jgi:hypothetical protein
MPRVNMPDPQHAHLNALLDEVHRLMDVEEVDLQWAFDEAPESVVFCSSDLEEYDHEEAMEMVQMVGGRDLDNKIRYWTRILESIRDRDTCEHETPSDVPCSKCEDGEEI